MGLRLDALENRLDSLEHRVLRLEGAPEGSVEVDRVIEWMRLQAARRQRMQVHGAVIGLLLMLLGGLVWRLC
ncbi:MAG: hypothetical protein SFW67_06985 [Myxococcaceae bacterium]|nr:hypothetical protein [Myxococcaceae bacterium]